MTAARTAPQTTAQTVFQFDWMIDETVIDKTFNPRRAENVAERLAKLCILPGLHFVPDAVNAVFGQLDFPRMGIVGIVLSEPSRENADVSERDSARVAEIVGAEFGA